MLTYGLCACGSVSLDLFLMASSMVAYGQHSILFLCDCDDVTCGLSYSSITYLKEHLGP